MNNDIEDVLDQAKMYSLPTGEFEGELFLSTDGKNTVHVKASSSQGRTAAFAWAKEVYDKLRIEYGTKQALEKKVQEGGQNYGNCSEHPSETLVMSKKGKLYHKSQTGQYCFGNGKGYISFN